MATADAESRRAAWVRMNGGLLDSVQKSDGRGSLPDDRGVERRLSALLAADVEGYSRLMGADEEGTIKSLGRCREVIERAILAFHGRFIGSAGDSVLAEFASPVDAVRCAYEIQQSLWAINSDVPAHRRMNFRIGVNLGDVIVENRDIYGDTINVAARLEGLADAGGIAISAAVYEQIKRKTDYTFDDLGFHAVKNIAEPVRVYRVRVGGEAGPIKRNRAMARAIWRGAVIGIGALLAVEAAGIAAWRAFFVAPSVEAESEVQRPELTAEGKARLKLIPLPVDLKPGTVFRQCADCPELIVVQPGTFLMGSPDNEKGRHPEEIEGPRHQVRIQQAFAVGRFEITFREWDACVADGGCGHVPPERGWGRGSRPVIYVNWYDVREYLKWLSNLTKNEYRLPSEAEWEYAARAGTDTAYWWGNSIGVDKAVCTGCGPGMDGSRTVPVGSFAPNPFGIYDVHGNVYEWTADCWNGSYAGAPLDGSVWTSGDCSLRVLRSGAWGTEPEDLRAARRIKDERELRSGKRGFRVVMTLP